MVEPVIRGRPIVRREIVKSGIGFGSALAIAISFSVNKSVFWAIVHGLFSWFYVGYYLLVLKGRFW